MSYLEQGLAQVLEIRQRGVEEHIELNLGDHLQDESVVEGLHKTSLRFAALCSPRLALRNRLAEG